MVKQGMEQIQQRYAPLGFTFDNRLAAEAAHQVLADMTVEDTVHVLTRRAGCSAATASINIRLRTKSL